MSVEWFQVFLFDDHESVVHVSEPDFWFMLIKVQDISFKVLHEYIGNDRRDRAPHSTSMNLLVEGSSESEVGGGKNKLKKLQNTGD